MIEITKFYPQFYALPPKMNFKIGEVGKLLKKAPYTIRYWEREFSFLKPKRLKNQRFYSQKDMKKLILIKILLEYGLTYKGVNKHFSRFYGEIKNEISATKKD